MLGHNFAATPTPRMCAHSMDVAVCCVGLAPLQVAGTVGRKLLMGVRQGLQIDSKTKLDVRCKVGNEPGGAVCAYVAVLASMCMRLTHGYHLLIQPTQRVSSVQPPHQPHLLLNHPLPPTTHHHYHRHTHLHPLTLNNTGRLCRPVSTHGRKGNPADCSTGGPILRPAGAWGGGQDGLHV